MAGVDKRQIESTSIVSIDCIDPDQRFKQCFSGDIISDQLEKPVSITVGDINTNHSNLTVIRTRTRWSRCLNRHRFGYLIFSFIIISLTLLFLRTKLTLTKEEYNTDILNRQPDYNSNFRKVET